VPGVLTTSSKMGCATQGVVTAPSTAKLHADGAAVLLENGVSSWTVASCGKNPPCKTVAPPTAGVSTKLTVQGSAVLLATLQAQGSGGDPVTASMVQSKLTAV
jgi:hypothetical protein